MRRVEHACRLGAGHRPPHESRDGHRWYDYVPRPDESAALADYGVCDVVRRVVVRLAPHLVASFVKEGVAESLRVRHALPTDARLVAATFEDKGADGASLLLFFEHESFAAVPSGAALPERSVSFEVR